jgi:hypothetical protein
MHIEVGEFGAPMRGDAGDLSCATSWRHDDESRLHRRPVEPVDTKCGEAGKRGAGWCRGQGDSIAFSVRQRSVVGDDDAPGDALPPTRLDLVSDGLAAVLGIGIADSEDTRHMSTVST